REGKVGRYSLYEGQGDAFCVAEKKVVLFGKPETLRKVLTRDKEPQLSANMKAALKEADFSSTFAVALDVKGMTQKGGGPPGRNPGLTPFADPFGTGVLMNDAEAGAVDVKLPASGDVTVKSVIIYKDAKAAEDNKKIIEGKLAELRNNKD